jgi:hypothetical protein
VTEPEPVAPGDDGDDYERMLLIEDMESLLEEMEEAGVTGLEPPDRMPPELAARMDAAGVKNVEQLRELVTRLHSELDEDERLITDS